MAADVIVQYLLEGLKVMRIMNINQGIMIVLGKG
jgi:hypothetical protein